MRVRLIYISLKHNSKVEWPIISASRIQIFSNLLFVLSNNGQLEIKYTINLIALETDVLKIIFLLNVRSSHKFVPFFERLYMLRSFTYLSVS